MINIDEVKKRLRIVNPWDAKCPNFIRVCCGDFYIVTDDFDKQKAWDPSETQVSGFNEERFLKELKEFLKLALWIARINITKEAWDALQELLKSPEYYISKIRERRRKEKEIERLLEMRAEDLENGYPDGELSEAEYLYFYGAVDALETV